MDQLSSISIITVSHNRNEHLIQCISAISKCNCHIEHIVLDWNSNPAVLISDLPEDHRIRLIRVDHERHWWLTRAYNYAASFANGNWLLKVDADCILDQDFFDAFDPTHASLQTFGNLSLLTNNDTDFSGWGLFSVKRDIFERCGGFNEWIFGWGFDDIDLYERILEIPNATLALLPKCGIYMLKHTDNMRFGANHPAIGFPWLGWLLEAQLQGNIYIASCSRKAWKKIGPERFDPPTIDYALPSTDWQRIKRQRMLLSLLIEPLRKIMAGISIIIPDYVIRLILKFFGLLDWPN